MLPSALYQPNINHVLSVIAPYLAGLGVIMGRWRNSSVAVKTGFTVAALTLAGTVWLGLPVTLGAATFEWNPLPRLRRLNAGPDSVRDMRLARRVVAIQSVAAPSEAVLVLTHRIDCATLFFARRRHAALDYVLTSLLQPSEFERAVNLRAVERSRPAAILVAKSTQIEEFLSHPVLKEYRRAAFDDGEFQVLVRE